MTRAPILILKTGEADESIRSVHGDFEEMFAAALAIEMEDIRVVRPHHGEEIPSPGSFRAALVTGSASSLTEPAAWMRSTAKWLVEAEGAGLPLLGVCFGHQLLALAFGGRVERSPKGREIGTLPLTLSESGIGDPLFDGLPGTMTVQQTHEDVVVMPPPHAVVLAGSAHSDFQALAIGELIRTVQFHPEFDARICHGYLKARGKKLAEDARARGEDPVAWLEAIRRNIAESPHGSIVLSNWLRCFVDRDRKPQSPTKAAPLVH